MDNRATTTKRIGQFRLNFPRRKELNSDDPVFPAFDEGTPTPSFLCATRKFFVAVIEVVGSRRDHDVEKLFANVQQRRFIVFVPLSCFYNLS